MTFVNALCLNCCATAGAEFVLGVDFGLAGIAFRHVLLLLAGGKSMGRAALGNSGLSGHPACVLKNSILIGRSVTASFIFQKVDSGVLFM